MLDVISLGDNDSLTEPSLTMELLCLEALFEATNDEAPDTKEVQTKASAANGKRSIVSFLAAKNLPRGFSESC